MLKFHDRRLHRAPRPHCRRADERAREASRSGTRLMRSSLFPRNRKGRPRAAFMETPGRRSRGRAQFCVCHFASYTSCEKNARKNEKK